MTHSCQKKGKEIQLIRIIIRWSNMSQQVSGSLKGLKPSQIRDLERLFNRLLDKDELVPLAFARELFSVAQKISRRIGVLVDREGKVEHVVVGTREILYLPDLGRYRLGTGRLRRLRLIFSDLSRSDREIQIPSDIYTDLEKLRLDCVVAIKEDQNKVLAKLAHITPLQDESLAPIHMEIIPDLARFNLDFTAFIEGVEQELLGVQRPGKDLSNGVLLVGVSDSTAEEAARSMVELRELARTAGLDVRGEVIQRRKPDPRTLLGKGKLEEVVLRCLRLDAEMLVFDTELKPNQWRAITNSTDLKVLDRSMLILDIFAGRASSRDGKVQVELAQLKYNLPRLVEKDVGLSRLAGGIGGRGPGETKLEIGRRRIRDRVRQLEKEIDQLGKGRDLRRARRENNKVPLVSLLGYTNAGKSSLFNTMTHGSVLAEDKLFATLDPTQKQMGLPPIKKDQEALMVVLSDTVGFIRDLPAELVNAFRATLEELTHADLLIHVVDLSDENWEEKRISVEKLLADMDLKHIPILQLGNKIDLLSNEQREALHTSEPDMIAVSATSGDGLEQLKRKIHTTLAANLRNL